MGSAIVLGLALILTLSGCLEGNRYQRYGQNDGYSGVIDNTAWYIHARDSLFTQPLGYPASGDFSGEVKRIYVKSEAELISTIEAQTEPLVVVIASDIALTKPVVVRLPLLIQTTTEFGFPNSSLQFLASSGGLDAGGTLVVDAVPRKIQNLNCESLPDADLESQTFVKLQGNITNPKVVLKSNTHFVADLTSSFSKAIKVSSQHLHSTVVLVGDIKIDFINSVGRVAVIERSQANSLVDSFYSRDPFAKLKFLYLYSSFQSADEGLRHIDDFPEYYLAATNHCMSSGMFQQVLRTFRAKFYGTVSDTIEKFGADHKANCVASGWDEEVRQRNSCSIGEKTKSGANTAGGAL